MGVLRMFSTRLVLLAMLTAACHAVTEEPVVVSALPMIRRVDVESGVMLQQKNEVLIAVDLDSGATRWTRPIPQNRNELGVDIGLHHSVFFSDSGHLQVINHQTGKETARLNVSAGQGALQYASLSLNDQWVGLSYEGQSAFCELATRRQFQLPLRDNRTIGGRWMQDGKTLLLTEVVGEDSPPTQAQIWFWEVGVSEAVPGAVLESPLRMNVRAVLPDGGLLVHEYDPTADAKSFYSVVNAATGATLRAFERVRTSRVWSNNTEDGTLWYDYEETSNTLRVEDTLSGEYLFSLKMPGQKTRNAWVGPREAEKNWIISWEDNNNAWLVPLEKNGEPRKILDGSRYLPGRVTRIIPPNMLCVQLDPAPKMRTITLHSISGMKIIREWSFARSGISVVGLSADHEKLLLYDHHQDSSGVVSKKTMLLPAENEGPVPEIDGEPLLLSPDSRHAMVRKGQDQTALVCVDNGQAVKAYVPEGERYYGDIAAAFSAFSPDSRRAAVYHFPKLTVVDLVEGYPEKGMIFTKGDVYISDRNALCFSPDGTLLLGAGYGRAWLFNAGTGELLHTFIEEGRFAQPHQYRGGGFFNTLEGMASDYVGMVTDRYKSQPQLTCAFTMDGLRAVTVAQSQAARVWDVRTGAKVAAFITGLPETRNKSGMIDNRHVLSANGAYLFAYNADGYGTASLWETASGRKIKEYRISERVELAAIADDGRAVYVKIGEDLHILPGRAN